MDENLPISGPVFLIEVEKIKPNPHQPRRVFDQEALKDLSNSIREFGVLQPLTVTKVEKETEMGTVVEYELIAGERRLMASKLAGLERVPAIIRNVSLDRERLELAIIENVQREQLNPIEAARGYAKLQDQFSLTQREIAAKIGKSREAIANAMRLLNLPSEIQDAVSNGSVSESQARLLLSITEIPQQKALFEEVLRDNLSVRDIRNRILRIRSQQKIEQPDSVAPEIDPETKNLQKELEETLGTKVQLTKTGDSGKLTIVFYSPEELQNIISRLKQVVQEAKAVEQGFPPENSGPSEIVI